MYLLFRAGITNNYINAVIYILDPVENYNFLI